MKGQRSISRDSGIPSKQNGGNMEHRLDCICQECCDESVKVPIHFPDCPECPVFFGTLGNREWFKCRECGMEFSKEVE